MWGRAVARGRRGANGVLTQGFGDAANSNFMGRRVVRNRQKLACLGSLIATSWAVASCAWAQYSVVTVSNGGTITGTVKWSGARPQRVTLPITKNPDVCAPNGNKTRDLERIEIAPDGAVGNTVVYLKGVTSGKAWDLPEARRSLDQKNCRYIPHIMLVPKGENLSMKSSDPILHNIHMTGVALYNLPFPIKDKVIQRPFQRDGVVDLKCDAGHVWMNSELLVVDHPYYAITDEHGNFKITGIPAGTYTVEAWHESWHVARTESMIDVDTHQTVTRPVFAESLTWDQTVTVSPGATAKVEFQISEK